MAFHHDDVAFMREMKAQAGSLVGCIKCIKGCRHMSARSRPLASL